MPILQGGFKDKNKWERNAKSFLQISHLKIKTMIESNSHLHSLPKQMQETNDLCFPEES